MLLEYDKIIRDQLQAGFIETVESELTKGGAEACSKLSVHYLPHHGVVRQDSQTIS